MQSFPITRLLTLALCLSAVSLHGRTDWGSSHYLQAQFTLSEKWFLMHRSLLSTRNDFSDTFFGMGDLAVGYRVSDNLSLRLGYRRAWLKPGSNWLEERRPFVEVRHFTVRDGFAISNKPRLEFRRFDYRENDLRFRYELAIEAPWKLSPLGLKPYLENELFYSFDKGALEGNWLTVGLSWKPAKNTKIKLGYRWLTQRIGDEWINRNVINTGLLVFF